MLARDFWAWAVLSRWISWESLLPPDVRAGNASPGLQGPWPPRVWQLGGHRFPQPGQLWPLHSLPGQPLPGRCWGSPGRRGWHSSGCQNSFPRRVDGGNQAEVSICPLLTSWSPGCGAKCAGTWGAGAPRLDAQAHWSAWSGGSGLWGTTYTSLPSV